MGQRRITSLRHKPSVSDADLAAASAPQLGAGYRPSLGALPALEETPLPKRRPPSPAPTSASTPTPSVLRQGSAPTLTVPPAVIRAVQQPPSVQQPRPTMTDSAQYLHFLPPLPFS